MEVDYKLIISRLKDIKNISTDAELASILGVSPAQIGMIRHRNSANLGKILTICDDVDLNWLICGKVKNTQFSEKALFIEQKSEVERLEETIELQRELIGSLKEQIAMLKKEIADGRDIVVFGKAE